MSSSIVDEAWLRRVAEEHRYHQDSFERAYRLGHLLRELGEHDQLRDRVALKGGTCINFFHSALPRLSVDLDLNYVGSVDSEGMKRDRPDLESALIALAEAHGYQAEVERRSYAGSKARFLYENSHGARDSVRVDINYLMRVPLYGIVRLDLPGLFDLEPAQVPCLAIEDVFGSKLKALATRAQARDLYDAARFLRDGPSHDSGRLRRAFLFYCHMDDATLRTVDLQAVRRINQATVERDLYPMLRRDDRPRAEDLQAPIRPALTGMLHRSDDEIRFGTRLEAGEYVPQLLFGTDETDGAVALHPAALWRAKSPHGKRPDDEA